MRAVTRTEYNTQGTAGLIKVVSGVDVLLVCSSSTDRELRASRQVSLLIGQTRPHAGTGGTTRA